MERKATDILLELEEKVNKLLSYVINMDNNYKILISRLDQLKTSQISVAVPVVESSLKKNDIKNVKQEIKKPEEPITFINVEDSEPKPLSLNKVKVSQIVKYPKDKGTKQNNVILASVKVYDKNGAEGGNVVAENRTDQNGRWKIELSPGNYFVHIVKPASSQKPKIDHYFPISIDDQKASVELDSIG